MLARIVRSGHSFLRGLRPLGRFALVAGSVGAVSLCANFAYGERPAVSRAKCNACNSWSCLHTQNASTAGEWHWIRSPDQEKRVVVAQYNRYCVRCHGVDGKGVWDIPDVPDFTNARWQQCRTDAQLVRLTIEGRGACMPAFRGTLSLEETWAMARYLRTFAVVPAREIMPSPAPQDSNAKERDTESEQNKEKEKVRKMDSRRPNTSIAG